MAQEQEKYYSIRVGNSRPDAVEYARVNKEGAPIGPTKKGFAQVGVHGIPNSSEVWGKPELAKDGKRTGKITFLKWGDKDGQVVQIRYLKSTSSIDRLYQEQQGIKAGPEDIELVFQTGINKISRVDNPALVAMLENHSLNHDSVSRSPDIETFWFSEYNVNAELKEKNKARENKISAQQFVLDASKTDGGVEVLARIFNKDLMIDTGELQDTLFDDAETDPEGFLEHINKYKDNVEAKLIEAENFYVVDLAEPGKIIFTIEGKQRPIVVDAKFDRDQKMRYLKESALSPEMSTLLGLITDAVEAAKENLTK